MKGLTLIASGPLSKEAKEKMERGMKKRDEYLKKMVEDYRNGKFDDIIKKLK